ncbi:MAG: PAS domain-containing sensor histidine kinase [Bdellovibrionota bacterium]
MPEPIKARNKLPAEAVKRRNVELALSNAEQIFRLLVDAVSDYAIFALDPNGYVLTWNRGAERFKGYKANEIVGQHFSRFYMRSDIENGKPDMELRVAADEGRYEEEGWRVRKDGSLFWANVVITALRDQSGVLRGFAKVTRDLTERKRAEENLQQLNENLEKKVRERTEDLIKAAERLETAVKSRDEFLSIASHELKTPLTSLKLQVQMRKRAIEKQGAQAPFTLERLRQMVEDDEKQINRLNQLVDDMLDITRITAGKLTLQTELVDLCALIQEVTDRFAPQLEAAGCQVFFDADCKVEGQWDLYRIEQVFINLLTNAMKYGAGKPIQIKVSAADGIAKLAVRDYGVGIAAEDHERIFLQFERAISASEVSGLGLGLYIVRQIVEAHGGRILLESKLGEGSLFKVELPIANEPARRQSHQSR